MGDTIFLTIHGNLEPKSQSLRDLSNWGATNWPSELNPEIGPHNALIQECDFYKFRGRGPIQITFRNVYKKLISLIQKYNGTNPIILKYKGLWIGTDLNKLATESRNSDWHELFQSGVEIPMMSILAHNLEPGGSYLPLSRIVETLIAGPTSKGSIKNMARTISGDVKYADDTFNRVMEFLNAIE